MRTETTCMQCGGPVEALNRLENGRRCPACRDRHLAMVPPLLPGYRLEELASEADQDAPAEPVSVPSLRLCEPE